ncbi:Sodium/hydrogen exchanger 4 [Glycine max]|nr:Sodium/hydrogen exchanger 4 [Glycine max]
MPLRFFISRIVVARFLNFVSATVVLSERYIELKQKGHVFAKDVQNIYWIMTSLDYDKENIIFNDTIIIWWAGLMRGAVFIALAFKQVFGFLTKPLIRYLLPHSALRKTISHAESGPPVDDLNLPFLSLEESAETNISCAKESFSMLIESPMFTIYIAIGGGSEMPK